MLRVAQELPGDQRAPYVFPRMFGAALAPAMAADLVPLVREWAPDLLVHEQAELAAPLAGVAPVGVPVLAALGPGQAPESVGPQPGHVRVETWVDQAAVLASCSAVVSHGGSGTFLGALAHGLPQLCLPRAADQFRNAEGGLRSGAARVLRPDDVTPDAVGAALTALLADVSVRDAARAVAAEIAAMPSPADVVDLLARR